MAARPDAFFTALGLTALDRWRGFSAHAGLAWSDALSLTGPMPDQIRYSPAERFPADPAEARRLAQGIYALTGGTLEVEGAGAPWEARMPSPAFAEELHGFAWIRHFTHDADRRTAERLRWLIDTWLASCGRWHPVAWAPHVTARRLMSLFAHGRLIFDGANLVWRSKFLYSLSRQSRHLSRTAANAPEGARRLTAAIGLALSGLCLPHAQRRTPMGLRLAARELRSQVLADGGHASRDPEALLRLLADLLMLREALVAAQKSVPEPVQNAIDRMMPMLRFFRHGDGRLALFNGATEGPPGAIDALLGEDDVKGKPFGYAPHSRYQRMALGRTLIIADVGAPPQGAQSVRAHAGPLAFEMSVGRHRLIVNCGSSPMRGPEWERALRATAAHSTVTLADTSVCGFLSGALATRVLGARVTTPPFRVSSERVEDSNGIWLTSSHDGYAAAFGLTHERRLYLAPAGDDLRGEDALRRAGTRRLTGPVPFAIRFHLHPDVRASLARDGATVLLLLPNGDGWQFRASLTPLVLEESAYAGNGALVRKSRQIVIEGEADGPETVVKWAIRHLRKNTDPEEA
jgi:uncharacterized heparinase superfamily protein